jgi:hypothetical protein
MRKEDSNPALAELSEQQQREFDTEIDIIGQGRTVIGQLLSEREERERMHYKLVIMEHPTSAERVQRIAKDSLALGASAVHGTFGILRSVLGQSEDVF